MDDMIIAKEEMKEPRGPAIVMIIRMDNKSTKSSVKEQGSEQWNLQRMRESDTIEHLEKLVI